MAIWLRTGACSPRLWGVEMTCTSLSKPAFMMRMFFFCVMGMYCSARSGSGGGGGGGGDTTV